MRLAIASLLFLLSVSSPTPSKAGVRLSVAPASCTHTHTRAESRRAVRIVMRSPARITKGRGRKVWHYARCVHTRAAARHMRGFVKRWKVWRHSYTGRWRLAFERLPPAGQSWARVVSWRESHNRRYAPESGFLSYFQWVPSTWYAACACSMSPYSASWPHQATVAWYWHLGHPTGQWPNTGE